MVLLIEMLLHSFRARLPAQSWLGLRLFFFRSRCRALGGSFGLGFGAAGGLSSELLASSFKCEDEAAAAPCTGPCEPDGTSRLCSPERLDSELGIRAGAVLPGCSQKSRSEQRVSLGFSRVRSST